MCVMNVFKNYYSQFLTYLLLFLLPTQLGKYFFRDFSYISGVRIDYLAPALFLTDILVFALILWNWRVIYNFFKSRWTWILIILVFTNILFSLSPGITYYKWVKVLEFVLLFLILVKEKVNYGIALKVLLGSSAVQFILVLLQFNYKQSVQGIFYFLGERYLNLNTPDIAKASLNGIELLRPYGSFSHPNSMGGFYVLLYTFVLVSDRFKKYGLLRAGLLLISSFLVLMSFSKVVIGAYMLVNLAALWQSKKYKDCILCFVSRVAILLFVPLVFLLAKGDPDSLEKRIMLMWNSASIFFQNPLAGVGLGSYLLAQSKIPIQYSYYFLQPVHNIFLLFLTETGIIISGYFTYLLYRIRNLYMKNEKILYLLFVIAFSGTFDHYWLTLQQNTLIATVLMALAYSEPTLKTKPK